MDFLRTLCMCGRKLVRVCHLFCAFVEVEADVSVIMWVVMLQFMRVCTISMLVCVYINLYNWIGLVVTLFTCFCCVGCG